MTAADVGSAVAMARETLTAITRWYSAIAAGRWEGRGRLPFYCDPARTGAFAVDPVALAHGREPALFQLLVALAMYQSRRDVDIMAIQRTMRPSSAAAIIRPSRLRVLVEGSRCELLRDPNGFDARCSVRRTSGRASCAHRPRTACHVKDASVAIGRMGDMGKLPTSAWLHLRDCGGISGELRRVEAATNDRTERADAMVDFVSKIHRIGVKLATMFVSAIAVDELAPGLAPWAEQLDGSHLVVVDANVARVIDRLRPRGARTFAARARWFRRVASDVDLRRIRRDWPATSPRLVQQAVYLYRSRSNRVAHGDACATRTSPCRRCLPNLCPFAEGAAMRLRGGVR